MCFVVIAPGAPTVTRSCVGGCAFLLLLLWLASRLRSASRTQMIAGRTAARISQLICCGLPQLNQRLFGHEPEIGWENVAQGQSGGLRRESSDRLNYIPHVVR